MNNTNINEVVVDILSGVKVAGKEIYGASNKIILDSVSFIEKQSPDLFRQFIAWKLYEKVFYVSALSVPSLFLFFISYRLNQGFITTGGEGYLVTKWIIFTVSSIMLTINLIVNIPEIIKIISAPKIYMIEYITESMKR